MDKDGQLIKKNCETGEYYRLYPITKLSNVIDTETGDSIKNTVESINHFYIPFTDNSRVMTRRQIPPKYRRKGLWLTYITCHGTIVTEYYNNDKFTDSEWGNKDNWVQYEAFEDVSDIINSLNSTLTELKDSVGKPNGIASLDAEGKVPAENLPETTDRYELPVATENTLGGVRMKSETGFEVNKDYFYVSNPERPRVGIPYVSNSTNGLMESGTKDEHDSFFKERGTQKSWFQHFKELPIVNSLAYSSRTQDKVSLAVGYNTGEITSRQNVDIPAANSTYAGVMSAADKIKLDSLESSGGQPALNFVFELQMNTADETLIYDTTKYPELVAAIENNQTVFIKLVDGSDTYILPSIEQIKASNVRCFVTCYFKGIFYTFNIANYLGGSEYFVVNIDHYVIEIETMDEVNKTFTYKGYFSNIKNAIDRGIPILVRRGTYTVAAAIWGSINDIYSITAFQGESAIEFTFNASTNGSGSFLTGSYIPLASNSSDGLMSKEDKAKLDGISSGAGDYVLNQATSTTLGGVKIGYVANSKNYPVELDSDGKMFVNVPWTNTTYSVATSSANGLLSKEDKAKLDSMVAGTILTQAQYDALETKDPNMIYYIKG